MVARSSNPTLPSSSPGERSTAVTLAAEGPCQQPTAIASTLAGGPITSICTAPSSRLRTQPSRPSRGPSHRPPTVADALHAAVGDDADGDAVDWQGLGPRALT